MKPSVDPIILLVDYDATARRRLCDSLSANYRLLEACTAAKAFALIDSSKPTLVLTDLNLPDMDGVNFIRRIRESTESSVVVVSGPTRPETVIAALDAGAEDFIRRPFSIGELGARVRAALRHASLSHQGNRNSFRSGELEVDFNQHRVRISGKDVHLTPLEYRMLSMLIENAGRVLSYSRLLRAWNSQKRRQLHHVRVLMYQLRRKVEADPMKPCFLITAAGIGYRFQLRGQ